MALNYELPCDRDLDQVWERLDEIESGHADAHELDCPHCRTASESLLALRSATREMAAEVEQPPPDLLGKIMNAVRAEARRGHLVRLPTPEPGQVDVSEAAVAVVLRFAADQVDGVRARRCRVRVLGSGDSGEHLVRVELTLAVDVRIVDGGAALDQVRERVSAAATARVGLRITELDLVLDDIYDGGSDGS
ncbi:Asp23/Gls24 family envelope stress response protein [Amycolatopsis suaedae]|uniref:Asp23/Gls24 family envelope stress response protein n=1 Tax=Amycolatopsis suaedae TaxID=2510978 RepID=A0A4Q7JDN0_9PSEU|nr:Asp23/Gls24 family envelope stress response protein [Amycolatopsis suaedae]RZQ65192.1 Asp23/Gls24 family envelope stress response protein [Amycolatopsis suaedae]